MIFNPYPHQKAGVEWIEKNRACALFWGMGSGKTVTTLTAVNNLLYDYLEQGPVLIIAPKRVAEDTWSKETQKWEHLQHLRMSKIMGTVAQRIDAIYTEADLYVINRENVAWLVKFLNRRWMFPIVVIDELSSFKSQSAKRWRALRSVRKQMRRVIGLTGTPRPNGIEDLWAEIYLLDGGERLGNTITAFRKQYLKPDKMNGHIVYSYKPQEGAEDAVYDVLGDICMSIKKEDVISLPGQIYEDIVLETPMPLFKKYKKFEKEKVLECADADGEIIAGSEAALVNKLLQYANGAIYDADKQVHRLHDLKLDALEELIEEAGGDNVLVLYNYKHDAERIRERIPYCRTLDKPEDIDDWNAGNIPVAIAHPASVGHGLNLQQGGHILIWFGLNWSLELYQQANERLNRPGQTSVCRIYHILLKGTYDERVLQSLQRKEKGQTAALDALKYEIMNGGDSL